MDKKCSKKFGGKEFFSYLCQREILNKAYLKLIYFNKKTPDSAIPFLESHFFLSYCCVNRFFSLFLHPISKPLTIYYYNLQ
jgi:hypothetical protein